MSLFDIGMLVPRDVLLLCPVIVLCKGISLFLFYPPSCTNSKLCRAENRNEPLRDEENFHLLLTTQQDNGVERCVMPVGGAPGLSNQGLSQLLLNCWRLGVASRTGRVSCHAAFPFSPGIPFIDIIYCHSTLRS